MLNILFI